MFIIDINMQESQLDPDYPSLHEYEADMLYALIAKLNLTELEFIADEIEASIEEKEEQQGIKNSNTQNLSNQNQIIDI